MDHEKNPRSWNWEMIAKIFSAIFAIVTVLFGILQYKDQNERQYRQRVYEEQFNLYSEILDLSARLSATPLDSIQSNNFISLSNKFDKLYYGKMIMLQDSIVEKAMIEFRNAKEKYKAAAPDPTPAEFREFSVKLGFACKNSLVQTQSVNNLLF